MVAGHERAVAKGQFSLISRQTSDLKTMVMIYDPISKESRIKVDVGKFDSLTW